MLYADSNSLGRSRGLDQSEWFLTELERILQHERRSSGPPKLGRHHIRLIWRIQLSLEKEKFEDSPLSCPECTRQMIMMRIEGLDIDYCLKCRGFWFDRGELHQFTDMDVDVPGDQLRHRDSRFDCPICQQQMREYQFSHGSNLMVDACPTHGVYLEDHELVRALEVATRLQSDPEQPVE